jgi:hypothetical protein
LAHADPARIGAGQRIQDGDDPDDRLAVVRPFPGESVPVVVLAMNDVPLLGSAIGRMRQDAWTHA